MTYYTESDLNKMIVKDLKDICRNYKIPLSGKKADVVDRIIKYQIKLKKYQIKLKKKQTDLENLKKKGSTKKSLEFELVISTFQQWCDQYQFELYKHKNEFLLEKLDINEIRAIFAEYDVDKSELRKDSLVPKPENKLEEFLEMLFTDRLDTIWYFQDSSPDGERIFDDNHFSETITELYETNLTNNYN